MRISIFLLGATMLFAGCSPSDPFARELLTVKPKDSDCVGIYVFDMHSMGQYAPKLDEIIKGRKDPPVVELKADGQFKFHGVPDFDEQIRQPTPLFLGLSEASGSWQVDSVGGVGDGSNKIERVWGIRLTGVKGFMSYPAFTGKDHVLGLIFTYSDPDSGEVMKFRKK